MLRGRGNPLNENEKVFWFLGLLVSCFQSVLFYLFLGLLASWFLGFLVSWLLGFLAPWFLGLLVSLFLGFFVYYFLLSKIRRSFHIIWKVMIPYYRIIISRFWKSSDPVLPNVHFMFLFEEILIPYARFSKMCSWFLISIDPTLKISKHL